MIKILIISDDLEYWCDKITSEIKEYRLEKRKGLIIIYSDMFIFEILDYIDVKYPLGKKYSCCILDKYIEKIFIMKL